MEKFNLPSTLSLRDKTIEREFGNLLKIADNYPKMVVTMDEQFGNSYHGIKHLPIRKFLISENLLKI